MTFFGQFFDHGLDLVTKGGSGTVFIPLQPDDPLITVGPDGIAGTGDEVTNPGLQFMVLTRATNLAGADGLIGTADDLHENTNTTTPFVDQNQTYSSHPSHQVFLRDYIIGADWQAALDRTAADRHRRSEHGDLGRRQGERAEARPPAHRRRCRRCAALGDRRLRQRHARRQRLRASGRAHQQWRGWHRGNK